MLHVVAVHCLFGLFFVLGCATTPVAQYRAYHVNVSRLAQKLQSSAFIDTGVEVSPLLPPELPTFWYFGISGMPIPGDSLISL